MIRAKDWIVFLESGISMEELPIPEEHKEFCEQWIRKQKLLDAFHFEGYPRCIYHRKDIHKEINAEIY